MSSLFFSPSGYISRSDFKRCAAILLAINFFLWPAWHAGLGIGFTVALLGMASIYCWACLFIKRLRAAGMTGWMFLPILLGFMIGSWLLANILLGIMTGPELLEAVETVQAQDPIDPDMPVLLGAYEVITKAMVVPYAVSFFVVGALIAFTLNNRLSDNASNL